MSQPWLLIHTAHGFRSVRPISQLYRKGIFTAKNPMIQRYQLFQTGWNQTLGVNRWIKQHHYLGPSKINHHGCALCTNVLGGPMQHTSIPIITEN